MGEGGGGDRADPETERETQGKRESQRQTDRLQEFFVQVFHSFFSFTVQVHIQMQHRVTESLNTPHHVTSERALS